MGLDQWQIGPASEDLSFISIDGSRANGTNGANIYCHDGVGAMFPMIRLKKASTLMLGVDASRDKVGFFGSHGTKQPTISGSCSSGEALADLLTKLAALGLIVDNTTP